MWSFMCFCSFCLRFPTPMFSLQISSRCDTFCHVSFVTSMLPSAVFGIFGSFLQFLTKNSRTNKKPKNKCKKGLGIALGALWDQSPPKSPTPIQKFLRNSKIGNKARFGFSAPVCTIWSNFQPEIRFVSHIADFIEKHDTAP